MDNTKSVDTLPATGSSGTPPGSKPFGMLAEFASPGDVYEAAKKVRDAGYKHWDVHSPFPIHGMDKAMGIGQSKVGFIAWTGGLCGALGGFSLQYWVSVHANPFIIAGKPFNSYPAFVPVTFEPGILLTAFGAVFGMFFLNRLPTLYHALFKSKNFNRFSSDAFFISIEARDPKFDLASTKKLLGDIGGTNIEVVED